MILHYYAEMMQVNFAVMLFPLLWIEWIDNFPNC